MSVFDIAVIGAGPAGCHVAQQLAKSGMSVCLFERQVQNYPVLSESVFIKEFSIFHELDLLPILKQVMEFSTLLRFCDRKGEVSIEMQLKIDPESSLKNNLVRINKSKLNFILQELAKNHHVELFFNSSVKDVSFNSQENCWIIETDTKHTHARFLVDASGKTGLLNKKYNHVVEKKNLDPRIACFSHFFIPDSKNFLLESMMIVGLESGYLFSIPLSQNRLSLGVVVNTKKGEQYKDLESLYNQIIHEIPIVFKNLQGVKRVLPIIPIQNQESISIFPVGEKYLICGESAAFLDPFFSNGIQMALKTAKLAVEYVEKFLDNNIGSQEIALLRESYARDMRAIIDQEKSSLYSLCNPSEIIKGLCCLADPHISHFLQAFLLAHVIPSPEEQPFDLEKKMNIARGAFALCNS